MAKTKQDKVWVIEQGEYSSYRVVGVYSSKKNAKMVADLLNADDPCYYKATVAAWTIDPLIEEINAGLTPYRVYMWRDGTVEDVDCMEVDCTNLDGNRYFIWRRSKAPAYRGQGVEDVLNATVWARDEEHAVKIANEQRTQLIAANKWR